MECFFGAPVAPAAGGAGRVFRKSGISAGGGQARPCRTQGSAGRAGPCCRCHGPRQEQEEQQGKQNVARKAGGAEAVPRPGRGGSGGHQSRPAGCGRQEEISGILESTRGPAGRPPWEDCFRFSRCWFGVAEPWRRRSGPLPCPAPSAFAEKMRAARRRCHPPAGWLLQKRKETAGLPGLWTKHERTVCFLQDRG